MQSQAARVLESNSPRGVPTRVRSATVSLSKLSVASLARLLLRQSPAFLFVQLYVFLEYVRPQSIYESLDVLPWPLIALVGSVVFTLLEARLKFSSTKLWGAFAFFSLALIASAVFAQYPSASWQEKDVWINWTLLVVVIGAGIRTRNEYLLLLLAWCLWNLKMSQHGARAWVGSGFSFEAWGVSGAPGWFRNSGEFGIEMCVFIPIAGYLAFGTWTKLNRTRRAFAVFVVSTGIASVIATSSRGAFLGLAVVAAWITIRSPYRVRAGLLAISVVAATWLVLPDENKDRWRQAGQDRDSVARLTYWKDGIAIANKYPVLGIGYANWIPYYRANYNPVGEVPHNYLVEAASQLGYVGLSAFVLMTFLSFRENSRTRTLTGPQSDHPDRTLWAISYGLDGALIGFLASGFFVTVLFYPYYWMNLALTLALSRIVSARKAKGLSASNSHRANQSVAPSVHGAALAPR